MSILFGDMGLETEYEVARSPVNDTSGIALARTIEKRRGRYYRFRNKAEITVDFDYIEEADLTTLQKDLNDGSIGNYSFIDYPASSNLFNFVGVTNPSGTNAAFYDLNTSADATPTYIINNGTEFSNANYDSIEAVDSSYALLNPGASQYAHYLFSFKLDSWIAAYQTDLLRRISLLTAGNSDGDASGTGSIIRVWNGIDGAWEELSNTEDEGLESTDSAVRLYAKLWGVIAPSRAFSNFTDYISDTQFFYGSLAGGNFDSGDTLTNTSRAGTGKVFYDNGTNYCIIRVTSGSFVNGDNFNNGLGVSATISSTVSYRYMIYFGVRGQETNKRVLLNYVAMAMNGYEVVPLDGSNAFNFRESFTGAGYRGTLDLREL